VDFADFAGSFYFGCNGRRTGRSLINRFCCAIIGAPWEAIFLLQCLAPSSMAAFADVRDIDGITAIGTPEKMI
jgi:hypothetical protein